MIGSPQISDTRAEYAGLTYVPPVPAILRLYFSGCNL